ncbi:MAG: hypothetical protein ACRDJ9_27890 [Dehalococcoidia bacterium]
MTHAVGALRTTLLDGTALTWGGAGGWAWTIVTAVGRFAGGLTVFWWCERIAKRRGSLAQF